jgi:hypothetical protein
MESVCKVKLRSELTILRRGRIQRIFIQGIFIGSNFQQKAFNDRLAFEEIPESDSFIGQMRLILFDCSTRERKWGNSGKQLTELWPIGR